MNWYYVTQVKRVLRLIKKGFPVLVNNLFYPRKNNGLLSIPSEGYKSRTYIWEFQNENAYYGISNALRSYSGFCGSIPCTVEHGVYFGKGGTEELKKFNMPAVITYGEYRLKSLRKDTDRPVFKIGPYISYVKPYGSIESIKLKLGRTILVFPSHSIETSDVDYEFKEFVNFIEEIKKETKSETVLVSLYFKDISKFKSIYENYGYTVVCSGYRTDVDFLKKQRSFIELSDYVITNSVGTHIGYAVALGKPVSFYDQEVNMSFQNEATQRSIAPFITQDEFKQNMYNVKTPFLGFCDHISEEQIKVVNYYWGLDEIKTPSEIKEILDTSSKIMKITKNKGTNYKELFNECSSTSFKNSFKESL